MDATLLIVDDSVENLQILTSLLKDLYKIKIAKNGEKAMEIALASPAPDLVLLDVMMPDVDGFEVCQRLKSNAATRNIPVIFLTALNEVADETKGFEVGGADFITKPFNPEIVKARISTHLSLQAERRKSESLLRVLLPDHVVEDLITKGKHTPEVHNNVSVLFTDFVGFTTISSQLTPEFLIEELTEIFTAFDEIAEHHHVTRIKTIGDAYMAISGLHNNDPDHAVNMVHAGLAFIDYLNKRNTTAKQQWHCRIGVNSGCVIGGIIGKSRFIYDILGDDVNIAARVESNGISMKVTLTEATKNLLNNAFVFNDLGLKNLKGKGEMNLYTAERI